MRVRASLLCRDGVRGISRMLSVVTVDIHSPLPAAADVLTQTSKSGYFPQNYVALLGDSYAEGYGDWLQQGGKRSGPFHSAHIIQQQTGRDVVSFGIGGAGSAEAMVLRPAAVLPSSKCSVFPTIDQPRQMFISTPLRGIEWVILARFRAL
jgi:hypothetical protein